MGNTCEALCEPAINSTQLQQFFLNDKTTGKLISLSQDDKKQYWLKIKQMQITQNLPLELIPHEKGDDGFIYKPERYFYQGTIKNKVPHGRGRLRLLSAKITLDGTFKEGRLDGQSTILSSNFKIQGRWLNGFPHHIRFQKDKAQYFIEFEREKTAQGKIIFPNGCIYKGQFRYDFQQQMHIIEGKGVLTYQNGSILQGNFINGYLQGEGRLEQKQKGYIYRGNFKRGLLNGLGMMQMGDKGVLKIEWKDNEPHGEGEFMSNGSSIKIRYMNGARRYSQASQIEE